MLTFPDAILANPLIDPKEVGTDGKLVIAASESGTLYGLDVRASEVVMLQEYKHINVFYLQP